MKFYNDVTADMTYNRLRIEMEPFCARNFPSYKLSMAGFHQDHNTGEVIIKLHLTKAFPPIANLSNLHTAVACETPCDPSPKPLPNPKGWFSRIFGK